MATLLAVLLLAASQGAPGSCDLISPVAPDEASARRIAEAILRNVPAAREVRDAKAAGKPYDLIVHADPNDEGKWIAFQSPHHKPVKLAENEFELRFAGYGLGFRIDRCNGEISRMYYQR